MTHGHPGGDVKEVRGTLWSLIPAPTLWAVHFLVCYVTAAVYCAKAGLQADLAPVRIAIAIITVAVLAGIFAAGAHAYRIWGFELKIQPTHDADSIRDQRLFLGFAAFLLCGLSFVATLFVALPAMLIETCQ